MENKPAILGSRGEQFCANDFLLLKGFTKCEENLYNAETNPNGCINLGTSENRLMFDLLKERFNKVYNVQWEDYMYTYNTFQGRDDLRKAVAEFLTDQANSLTPLDPANISVFNGSGPCMEALTFAICDPGDGVMVPSPYYGGINFDLTTRPGAQIVPVHFYSKLEPGQTEPFHFTVTKLESVYQEQTKRHSLHLILNEVYMNSIFKEGVKHHSILGFKPEEIPDRQRVHFVWAASKDMSMSGMRFGVIHSWNEKVVQAVNSVGYFQSTPVYIQTLMTRFLSDRDWLNNVYFPTNKKRLREAHKITTDILDEIGVPYLNRPSGLYVYADFRKFMSSVTEENEIALFYRFIKDGAYIAPSLAFYANEQGWFRIVFSRPFEEVKLAMGRIAQTCKALLEENKTSPQATDNDMMNKASDQASGEGDSLESLLSQLKSGIQNSDWLEKNTAEQWKKENPQLYKDYMDSLK